MIFSENLLLIRKPVLNSHLQPKSLYQFICLSITHPLSGGFCPRFWGLEIREISKLLFPTGKVLEFGPNNNKVTLDINCQSSTVLLLRRKRSHGGPFKLKSCNPPSNLSSWTRSDLNTITSTKPILSTKGPEVAKQMVATSQL